MPRSHSQAFLATMVIHMLGAVSCSDVALGQTYPPSNPFMGPVGTSTMHANAASSGATTYSGPGSGPVSIVQQNSSAVFASILMASDGMLMCVAAKFIDATPWGQLVAPVSLATVAEMKLVKSNTRDLAG